MGRGEFRGESDWDPTPIGKPPTNAAVAPRTTGAGIRHHGRTSVNFLPDRSPGRGDKGKINEEEEEMSAYLWRNEQKCAW